MPESTASPTPGNGNGAVSRGWWSAEGEITASHWNAVRDELSRAAAAGQHIVVADGITLRWHPPIDPFDRWRLIRVSTDLLSQFGTRTECGERITAEWGEPDADGVYEPIFRTEPRDPSDPTDEGDPQ